MAKFEVWSLQFSMSATCPIVSTICDAMPLLQ